MPELRVESEQIIESSVHVCVSSMRGNIKKTNTCVNLLYAKDCKCNKKHKKNTHGLNTRIDWKKKQKVTIVNKDQLNSQAPTVDIDNQDKTIKTSKECNHKSTSKYLLDLAKKPDDQTEISDKITKLIINTSVDLSKKTVEDTTIISADDKLLANEQHNESKLISTAQVVKNSAERFFLESGILGTMGLASSILKKTSKINPILNDSNIKEVVSLKLQLHFKCVQNNGLFC